MSSLFGDKIQDIDIDELRQGAQKVLESTSSKAKSAFDYATERFEKLDDDKKNMIIIGLSVFAVVVVVAGIFYLIG